MPKVFVSAVIQAPVERVWAAIRDFDGLPDWHPAFADSRIEDGRSGEAVGGVRSFRLKDGGDIRERLLTLSDLEHTCTYTILESPLPIEDYVSTLRLRPVTMSGATYAEWSSSFEVDPADRDAMVEALTGVYTSGFEALRERFGT